MGFRPRRPLSPCCPGAGFSPKTFGLGMNISAFRTLDFRFRTLHFFALRAIRWLTASRRNRKSEIENPVILSRQRPILSLESVHDFFGLICLDLLGFLVRIQRSAPRLARKS